MKGSFRAYARHRGVDPTGVEKALAAGRITREADGQIDFEKADREWAQKTAPHAPYISSTATAAEEDGLGTAQYTRARAIREFYQARLAKIEYEERVGRLISKDEVQTAAFNKYRQIREQMLNIPDRIAAVIAAELGGDAKRCRDILDAEIRRALHEFADSSHSRSSL